MKKISVLVVLTFVFSLLTASYGFVGTEVVTKEIKEKNAENRSEVIVKYPQIKHSDMKLAKRFNDKTESIIMSKVKGFKADVAEMESDNEGTRSVGYELTIDFEVDMIGKDFISVSFGESTYLGGAHPNHQSYALNYNLKTGKTFELNDMFKNDANYLKTISAYSIMKLAEKQEVKTDWIEKGASAKDENFDSFTISQHGLKFVFDPYQVGAYAMGSFEVLMPYESLPIDIRSNWMTEIVNDISGNESMSKYLIFDGESYKNTAVKITKKDHEFAQNQFQNAEELLYKSGELTCDNDAKMEAEVKAIAQGSFTQPNVHQTAYLYEYCRNNDLAGNISGIGGIIITENGKTVSHFAYGKKMLFTNAYTLPDINKNGLSELVLVSSKKELGLRTGALDIIETHKESVKFIGRTQVFVNDYVAIDDKSKATSVSHKIFVEPNSNPTFYREGYTSKDNGQNYKLTNKIESFKISTDDPIVYEFMELVY